VRNYLNGGDWQLVAEFTEVESGKRSDRPEFAKALAACRLHRATLVISKLDRLSRTHCNHWPSGNEGTSRVSSWQKVRGFHCELGRASGVTAKQCPASP
jgi:DNA invertase Pin-like site-specific DNA recombinase